MHHHRSSNVPVENAPALTAVFALGQRFCSDESALRAFLRGSSRIDLDKLDTGTCSLVFEHCGQLRPRGVVDVLGKHTPRQAFDVEVFDCDPAESIDKAPGDSVKMIAATVGRLGVMLGQSGDALPSGVLPRLHLATAR
jgi:hypothetical protein